MDGLVDLWMVLWPALAIAGLRVIDVALGVLRTVFVVQERRTVAGLVATAEAAVWISAAGIVFADMTVVRAAGFCVGVGLGTVVGVAVTRRMRLGRVTVRVYVPCAHEGVGQPMTAQSIRDAGFAATVFRGEGRDGPVDMVLSTVRRRDVDTVLEVVRETAPDALVSVDNDLVPAMGASPVVRV